MPYDDAEYISKSKDVSVQRAKLADSKRKKGLLTTAKSSKKVTEKKKKSKAGVEAPRKKRTQEPSSDDEEYNFNLAAPTVEEEMKFVAERAIVGDSALPDPLEGLSLPSNEFVALVTQAKADKSLTDTDLLQRAHNYFTKLNSDDQRRNRQAFQRLREMKRINKQGGDKDGFKFVIPKSVTTIVRQIAAAEGVEGADVDPESLSSQFIGDGVAETSAKPMRSYKPRKQCFDDFYQFQVAKKWTKNAESFLARGRMTKKMFTAKQGKSLDPQNVKQKQKLLL